MGYFYCMTEQEIDYKRIQFEFAKRSYTEFITERPHLLPYMKPEKTPLLLIDSGGIRSRYVSIKYHMPFVKVYYAVKANDHIDVIKTLADLGSGFEVASAAELEKVLSLGVKPDRIISSNPVKPMEFIEIAYKSGVDRLAVDSFTEVDKLCKVSKRFRVYVRIVVPNEGSDWPLSKKFGVDVDTALEILKYAKDKGLIPYGITFHVGSQCNNYRNWFIAFRRARELWDKALSNGLRLQMLNMGGGIPVKYAYESLRIEDIGYYIRGLLQKYFPIPPHELQIEPGRSIVGDQGIMITKVIGKAVRGGENWLYIDTGVFNGLAEAIGGIRYAFYTNKEGDLLEWTIGGISCDSMDVVAKNVALPDVEVGDYIYILSAGAYTTVYGAPFNGFPPPDVVVV